MNALQFSPKTGFKGFFFLWFKHILQRIGLLEYYEIYRTSIRTYFEFQIIF